jgi:hypothetical protein
LVIGHELSSIHPSLSKHRHRVDWWILSELRVPSSSASLPFVTYAANGS